MSIYISILFVVFSINLYSVITTLEIGKKIFKIFMFILLSTCLLRYISLFILYISKAPLNLYLLKNISLVSVLCIPVTSFVSCKLLNKDGLSKIETIFILILSSIYMWIIYKAPIGIQPADIGYKIILGNNWPIIISIIEGLFCAVMIYLSISYMVSYKRNYQRVANFLFLLGYISAICEGLLIITETYILPWFIISEGILLLAISISIKAKKV